jgi:hypothetical protein
MSTYVKGNDILVSPDTVFVGGISAFVSVHELSVSDFFVLKS